jgi:hypothetical protein
MIDGIQFDIDLIKLKEKALAMVKEETRNAKLSNNQYDKMQELSLALVKNRVSLIVEKDKTKRNELSEEIDRIEMLLASLLRTQTYAGMISTERIIYGSIRIALETLGDIALSVATNIIDKNLNK